MENNIILIIIPWSRHSLVFLELTGVTSAPYVGVERPALSWMRAHTRARARERGTICF